MGRLFLGGTGVGFGPGIATGIEGQDGQEAEADKGGAHAEMVPRNPGRQSWGV